MHISSSVLLDFTLLSLKSFWKNIADKAQNRKISGVAFLTWVVTRIGINSAKNKQKHIITMLLFLEHQKQTAF